ncbi:MAG: hypothetical protein Q8918_02190 [Bacteroidota bacterium]|nr:hypothetical protein [Bacteroidota bacterium]MDP4212294.1 hypothetical protein [Bacteroidota bacterium]MDP4248901.1 hypothetical protein [Bacteroidota bacterium]
MKTQIKLETQRTWVYRKSYRPSGNIYHFLKTVMVVLVEGQSPYGASHPYSRKKK